MTSPLSERVRCCPAGDEAGAAFEQTARCHLKLSSPHEAATAYSDAANCYKKTNSQRA